MMAKCVLSHGSASKGRQGIGGNDEDLEDKLYQLKEQNVVLKREAHNANYQVRCLNTKLTRLINEKKRLVRDGGQTSREVEMEELIFNMNVKLEKLMRENEKLHHNTLLLRTQLQPTTARTRGRTTNVRPVSSYSHVKPRVDTGLESKTSSRLGSLSRNRSVSMTSLTSPKVTFGQTPRYRSNGYESNGYESNGCKLNGCKLNGYRSNSYRSNGFPTADTFQTETQRHFSPRRSDDDSLEKDHITVRLLSEARNEIQTLEDVVANQQSFIESSCQMRNPESHRHSKPVNGCEKERQMFPDDANEPPIALEGFESGSTVLQRSHRSKDHESKSEQTQTELDLMQTSSQIDLNRRGRVNEMMTDIDLNRRGRVNEMMTDIDLNRRGRVNEMMTVYLVKLEDELRRAREEMSEIQEQLILAKMNSIKVDELDRKIKSLEKENKILQESLSTTSSELLTDQKEKSLLTLQKSLKQYQAQVSFLEEEKRLVETELSFQREKVRKEMEEKFELKSMLNEAKKQIEELESKSSLVPVQSSNVQSSNVQCDHHDLTTQLIHMEQERNVFLNEFTEMKQMLELVQTSIVDSEWK